MFTVVESQSQNYDTTAQRKTRIAISKQGLQWKDCIIQDWLPVEV